jgi:flotillin
MAGALEAVAAAWKETGGRAMDIFVLQNLDAIFAEVARAARKVKVAQVNLLDGGDGHTISAYAAAYPATVGALLKEISSTLGVDVARVMGATTNGHGQ